MRLAARRPRLLPLGVCPNDFSMRGADGSGWVVGLTKASPGFCPTML